MKNLLLLSLTGCLLVVISVLIYRFDTNLLPKEAPDKIGFIILGDVNEPGWNGSHYQGIKTACDKLGLTLLYRDNVAEQTGQCAQAVRELAAEQVSMIFLCSFGYAREVRDLIDSYRNIAFVTNSWGTEAQNLTACFARMYQGRYLSGVLAGMKSKSGRIGYVAAIHNQEVYRGINAFTLGVRRSNPNARVLVSFSGSWADPEVERAQALRLIDEYGVDVLAYHQDERTVADVAEQKDIDFIGYNEILHDYSDHNLTSVICHWDIFYADILRRHLKGELNSLTNSWIGMDRGAVLLTPYSSRVNRSERAVLDQIRLELSRGEESIFHGELYDRDGMLRSGHGENISDYALLNDMTWLVAGVEIID